MARQVLNTQAELQIFAHQWMMQIEAGVPAQMVDVLQGAILFFLTAEILVRYIFRIRARSAKVSELQTVAETYGGQAAP